MKWLRVFSLHLVLFLYFFIVDLCAQVLVTIKPPPPNQIRVEHLWDISIFNSTSKEYEVFLIGEVTEQNNGIIFNARSNQFLLKAGYNKIAPSMLKPININYSEKRYEDIIIKTGSLPEGEFNYCIRVIESSTEQEIGFNCLPVIHSVRNQFIPILISPSNGEIVDDEYPMFVVILQNDHPTDFGPTRTPSYAEKKIVEIVGNQSPLDAINSNPAWFEITTNQRFFRYPMWARKFENGKRYAWQVKILDENNNVLGKSEVNSFEYLRRQLTEDEGFSPTFKGEAKLNSFFGRNQSLTEIPLNSSIPSLKRDINCSLNIQEDEISPFKLSGNTNFYTQYSDRQAINSEIPKNLWRWDLNTTLSIFEIPIGFSVFVSSEQKDIRQNINAFKFQFSPQQIIMNKTSELRDNFVSNFLSLFSNISVGTCYPNYSPLTISGIPVSGIDIEFTPGIFYLSFTYGRSQKEIQGDSITNPTYLRKMLSGKIGLGQKQSSHLHLTFMHSWDDEKSVIIDTFIVSPQENFLVGAEAQISFLDKLFNIKAELVGSLITRDIRSTELTNTKIPDWITKTIRPNISTSFDYAYNIATSLNLPTATKLSGYYKLIGPGFSTHGIPYLRNDIKAYEIRAEQKLFENQVTVGSYYKNDRDNLIPWKRATTTNSSAGFNLGLRFKSIPYINLNYSPYYQENNLDSMKIDNKLKMLSIVSGYIYKISSLNLASNIFFSYKDNNSRNRMSNYIAKNYSFNQTISFEYPLVLSTTISYLQSSHLTASKNILSFELNGSYTAFEDWHNTIGINLATERNMEQKYGFYFTTSFPIWNIALFELTGEKNFYKDFIMNNNNFDELIIRGKISKSW